ncbi:MAG: tetratricopeptide repeat protein, partial [Cyanobacteria bacterium P01_A01_bin.37]
MPISRIAQGKYEEAKQLYERAMAITEKALGAEHPSLAIRLNNLAGLLEDQVCRCLRVVFKLWRSLESRRATTTRP